MPDNVNNVISEEQQLKDVAIANTPTINAQYLSETNQAADAMALPRPILYGFIEHKSGFDVQRESTMDSVGLTGLPLSTIANYAPEAESYGLGTDEDALDRADAEVRTQVRVASQLLSNSYGNTSVMDNGEINENVLRDTYEGVMRTAYGADYEANEDDVQGYITAVKKYVDSGAEPVFKNADVVMKRNYDAEYNTVLTSEEEQEFNKWFKDAKDKGIIAPEDDGQDYDWRGYWKDNQGEIQGNYEAHFTDQYKKPNHPTITEGSIFYQQGYIKKDQVGKFVSEDQVPELEKKGIPYIIEPDTGAVYVPPKSRRNKEGVTGGAAPTDFPINKGPTDIALGSNLSDVPEESGLFNYFGKIKKSFGSKIARWNKENLINREVEKNPDKYLDNTSTNSSSIVMYDPLTGTYILKGQCQVVMKRAFNQKPVEATINAMMKEGRGVQAISEVVYTWNDFNKAEEEERTAEEIEQKRIAKEEAFANMYGEVTAYQAQRGFMPNLLPANTKQDIWNSMGRASLNPEDVETVNNFVDTFKNQVVKNSNCEVEAMLNAQSLKWDSSGNKEKKKLNDTDASALVLAARFMYNGDDRTGRIFLESAVMGGSNEEDPFNALSNKDKERKIREIRKQIPVLDNMDFSSRLQGSALIRPTDSMVRAIASASEREKAHSKLGIATGTYDIVDQVNNMYVTDSSTQLYFTRGQVPEQYMNKKMLRTLDAYLKSTAIQAARKGALDIYDTALTPPQWEAIERKLGISATVAQATEAEQIKIRREALKKYITQNRDAVLHPYTNGLNFSVALKLDNDFVSLTLDSVDAYGNPTKEPLSFSALESVQNVAKSSERLEEMLTKYGNIIDFSKVPANVRPSDLERLIKESDRFPATLHRLSRKGITEDQAQAYRRAYMNSVLDGYVTLANEVSKYDRNGEFISPEDLFTSYIQAVTKGYNLYGEKFIPKDILGLGNFPVPRAFDMANSFRSKIPKEEIDAIVDSIAQTEIGLIKSRELPQKVIETMGKVITSIFVGIGGFFETVFPEKPDIYGGQ